MPKERIRSAELAQKTADKAKTAADELQNFAVKAKESAYEAKTTVSDAKNTLREVRRAGRQTVRDVKQNIRLTKSGVQVGGPLNTTGIPDIEPSSLSSSVSGTMHGTNISFTPKSRAKLADKPLIKYKNVKTIYKSPIKVNVSSPKIPPLTNEGPLNAISKPKAYPESIKPVSTPANSIEINSMSQSGYLRKGIKPLRNTVDMPKITQTSAKSTSKAYKTAKKRIKDTAKGTVKTAKKSVKTAEQTAKAAVKTARQTTKTAQKSAQTAAKAAKASVKVSQ
ncbi:MAG: hypothetical protein LBR98_01350, partial [Syntrophomonadaceae bacterium]|nr:hypothetical protein [Syntrophomonadaceae bacterium]